MKRLPIGLLLVIALAWAAPAQAQLFFPKKQKPNPTQRVPELIVIVKTDPDEHKRTHAAEELREYDAAVFTEIVPVLADVLLHDKKMNVRLEALNSLTKIRPVSTTAGRAMEKAAADDESLRVRLQAKASLPKYHLAGYSSKSAMPASNGKAQTEEPPLATPTPPAPPKVVASPPAPPRVVGSVPSDPPIPRPFPPIAVPPVKTPEPGQGPSLFP
jgi:HEAT repeat protein